MFMYKFSNDMLPHLFNIIFVYNKSIHDNNTRQSRKIHVSKFSYSAIKKSIRYKGTVFWNYISDIMNCKCTIGTFKTNLKSYLMNNNISENILH